MKRLNIAIAFLLMFWLLGCGIGEQSNIIIGNLSGSATSRTCDINVALYSTNTVGGKITEWKIELLTYDSVVITITSKTVDTFFPITVNPDEIVIGYNINSGIGQLKSEPESNISFWIHDGFGKTQIVNETYNNLFQNKKPSNIRATVTVKDDNWHTYTVTKTEPFIFS